MRPTSKQLAMAFYQSLPFKPRERLSALVPLAEPHTTDGTAVSAPETLHLSGMVIEVKVQCEPAGSGFPHSAEPFPRLSSYESSQTTPSAQQHKQPRREYDGGSP
jgi:hypothetical protein